MKFTLKRKSPSGGFAYGTFVNALIGLPLYDRRYLPINWFPLANVTRKSFDVIVHAKSNIHKINNRVTILCDILIGDFIFFTLLNGSFVIAIIL